MRYGAVILVLALASPIGAQRSTTDCRRASDGRIVCDTREVRRQKGVFETLRDANDSSEARKARREVADAQVQLYSDRAFAMLAFVADSLKLEGDARNAFWTEGKAVLVKLYAVSPKATNTEMRDALYPLARRSPAP